jgi:uncharacterized protein (TIGR02246 family)
MKALLLVVVFATAMPDSSKEAAAVAAAEVKKVEREWLDAYEKHDAEAMDRFVAEDFVITFANGTRQTKPQLMAEIRKPRDASQPAPKFTTEDVTARTYGDTVILTGRVVTEITGGDKTVRHESSYTDTYVKKDGRWQVVASHLSAVPKPAK